MMATTTPEEVPPPPAPVKAGPKPRRRQLKWIVAVIVLLIAAIAGFRYWHEATQYVSTDNAYVQANQAEIASQVTGPVAKVYVRDQQAVKSGEPLFDIDPTNYELALEKARAQLEIARQGMSQESAAVGSAQAVLAQRQAEAANARGTYNRNQELLKSGFLSPQGIENSRTQLATAEAAVKAAEAGVAQARSALGRGGAQNATGNWVKVTQRVPVRIKVDDPDPQYPLRIGTTASVKVKKNP